MSSSQLTILFRDDYIVVIDKPAGMLVHRSRIDVHANESAMQLLRDQMGRLVYPVHRIDRPTSGVLLFALNRQIARALSIQFEERSVSKSYLAIVRGHVPLTTTWNEPLIEKRDRIVDRKAREDKEAQAAESVFECHRRWTVPFSAGKYPSSRYSLIEARPLTGRKHQLRRHLNHMAHPIIGDTTYGDRRHNRLFRETFGVGRLLLMAKCIEFTHPISGVRLRVEAAMGGEFGEAVESLEASNIEGDESSPV